MRHGIYIEYFHFLGKAFKFMKRIPWMWILDLNFKIGLPSGKW